MPPGTHERLAIQSMFPPYFEFDADTSKIALNVDKTFISFTDKLGKIRNGTIYFNDRMYA